LPQSFFWDKLPDSRVEGTFWAANPADYGLLAPCAADAEELFQVNERLRRMDILLWNRHLTYNR